MALEFTFTLSEEEARKALAKKLTVDEWLELFEINSNTYNDWSIDLKLAEAFVNKVKEGYIDKYLDDNIPEVLRPILIQSLSDDLAKKNEANKDITLEHVSGEAELEAIKRLREYSSLDYSDAVNLFCDGYDFALEKAESNTDLSEVSTEDLLREIQNRTK